MSSKNLGRLEKVALREVWEREDGHFTPWLAQEENLQLLGETLGIELELEAQEKEVGPFRTDLLCMDTATGDWVIIENQLERTDHNHLGQIMTYAAGLEAATIVWIASNFREEHRAALDWLNEITEDHAYFFGLEVELWRIGDSHIAPKFNVVSKPNDWSKSVTEMARITEAGGLTDTQKLYWDFWAALQDYSIENEANIRDIKPDGDSWTRFEIGNPNFQRGINLSKKYDRVVVGLILKGFNAKPHFNLLKSEAESIEREFGKPLEWQELPQYNRSRINLTWENAQLADKTQWPELFSWIVENLEKFDQVFRMRIKTLDASDYQEPDGQNSIE